VLAAWLALAPGFCASFSLRAQEEQQRERRAEDTALPTVASKSLQDLRGRIQDILRRPEVAPAMVGIKVVSLDSGRTLFEENAVKLLRPASNMKLYTWAAALDRLTPDYHFRTSIYAPARADAAGTIHGDLVVYGRGDPSYAARFNNGDYAKAIDELAARIAAAGVKKVEGDLVGDETYLNGSPFGSGWEWDDLQWWYGAGASALTINDNSIDLAVKPGPAVGTPCTITTGPATPLVTFINHTTTTAQGAPSALSVYRGLGENSVEVGGSLPLGDKGYNGIIAIPHPALMFVYMLRSSLARLGINITGRSRAVEVHGADGHPTQTDSQIEITSTLSPPLSIIAADTLKPSQNLYTELVLRTLGKVAGSSSKITNDEAGLEIVKAFLRQAGIDPSAIVLTDGSGLSRNDMVTPDATVQLLTFMAHHRYAAAYRDALPIAGVDGTLRNRMKKTPAAGNVRAKTGTLASAASLSGYVTSASGEHLVFSIMVNNYPDGAETEIRRNVIDAIAVMLASFGGRS
jgi:D-alanyl-D-alanine carboxypeptidase/D-alanyl-D-alanine-endopeptidase (penicillin-binding protein 4)